MNEPDPNDVLSALGAHLREERARHAPLEKRLEGQLSRDEVTQMLHSASAPAGAGDVSPDPETQDLYEPLSERERDALVAAVERSLGGAAAPAAGRRVESGPTPTPPRRGVVVALRRIAPIAAPLTLAAAVALFVLRPSHGDGLPPYHLTASGGVSLVRGAAPEGSALRVAGGAPYQLVLQPEQPAVGEVQARVFLRGVVDIELTPTSVEVSKEGAVRIRGAFPETSPDAPLLGASLVVVVGRPAEVAKGLAAPPSALHAVALVPSR